MAVDYDELRTEVKESQNNNSLEAITVASTRDAQGVQRDMEEADDLDEATVPGGEIVADELIIQVIPQAVDEFTCSSCFLVRHRSQIASEKAGNAFCRECEA